MPPQLLDAPVPVTVITGPLGVGKTTLIARLVANKPPDKHVVVLLNEFTEAGIDALTIASAAVGRYDVRLVAGGCLCCTGERDFRRNLQEVLASAAADHIIVEPSGLSHPGGMVDELLAWQAKGALQIVQVLGLIDSARLSDQSAIEQGLLRDQLEIADQLVLSKSDIATSAAPALMTQLAADLYPPRNWRTSAEVAIEVWRGDVVSCDGDRAVGRTGFRAQAVHQLSHQGASWRFPRGQLFSEPRLISAFSHASALSSGAVRAKGVFQVAEDCWLLMQTSGAAIASQESSWRRDSRVEVVVEGDSTEWTDWERLWSSCLRLAATPPVVTDATAG